MNPKHDKPGAISQRSGSQHSVSAESAGRHGPGHGGDLEEEGP